ncbi:hypothetical protein TNCV_1941841 [Trichonephila clavipes]|uniref:Uncharacterized protein n=1 Tax=Trichonephila clavipes TaxID=2585209 RepID=A0A8X6S9J1_TRICX|nr:hypothetical protein TNCV_1941841 [Trichonephila clavipes]
MDKGGAGIHLIHPNSGPESFRILTGYDCLYKQSSYSPKNLHFAMDTSHKDNFNNKQAGNLAKETWNSPQLSNSPTLTNADAIARCKLTSHPVKKHF